MTRGQAGNPLKVVFAEVFIDVKEGEGKGWAAVAVPSLTLVLGCDGGVLACVMGVLKLKRPLGSR